MWLPSSHAVLSGVFLIFFQPKFCSVNQLYLIILNILMISCHYLPLLLYQQVKRCWFDQQGAVFLKPNITLGVVRFFLWLVMYYTRST